MINASGYDSSYQLPNWYYPTLWNFVLQPQFHKAHVCKGCVLHNCNKMHKKGYSKICNFFIKLIAQVGCYSHYRHLFKFERSKMISCPECWIMPTCLIPMVMRLTFGWKWTYSDYLPLFLIFMIMSAIPLPWGQNPSKLSFSAFTRKTNSVINLQTAIVHVDNENYVCTFIPIAVQTFHL